MTPAPGRADTPAVPRAAATPAARGLGRAALLAPLVLFAAFLLVVGFGLRRDPHYTVRSALIGKPAPPFDLPGYDATHPGLSNADLAHGGVSVVNVFGSWCIPCRVESPQLAALAKTGVPVHAIAVHDSADGLATFFRNYGNPYRRIGMDADGRAQIAWGSSGVPETFVVDGRGIVRAQHIGAVSDDDLPGLVADIRAARS